MNAEIEHASPYGKAPGEKVPGEKRKIGPGRDARLARASSATAPSRTTRAPRTTAPRTACALPAPAPSGASYWMLGAGVVAAQVWMALKALRRTKIGA